MEGWKEFTDSGMLWWVNRVLHTFGWSIFVDVDDDGNVLAAYPQRTTWLGFPPEVDEERLAQFKKTIGRT